MNNNQTNPKFGEIQNFIKYRWNTIHHDYYLDLEGRNKFQRVEDIV